jgi:Mrp family chromosome partitioning ATPase
MFGRGRTPVLARVPLDQVPDRRPGTLDRRGLAALLELWSEVKHGVVLVTGHEERSDLAIAMAASASAAGRGTVLIECELAAPELAVRLGLDPVPGFGEYLAHEAEAPEILQAAILAGPGSTLAAAPLVCIVAGGATRLGPVLLGSESFAHAIAKARDAYDVVVLDGPGLDDANALRAAAAQVDRVLASCPRSRIPRRLRSLVDGLVETAA